MIDLITVEYCVKSLPSNSLHRDVLCERKNFFLNHYIEKKITYFQVIYFSKSSHKPSRKIITFNFYLTISIITRLATNYYYITIRINEEIKFLPSPHFCIGPKWKERTEG